MKADRDQVRGSGGSSAAPDAAADLLATASALFGGAPSALLRRGEDGILALLASRGTTAPGWPQASRIADAIAARPHCLRAASAPDRDGSALACAVAPAPGGGEIVIACDAPPPAPGHPAGDALRALARLAAALSSPAPAVDAPNPLLQRVIDAVPDHIWVKDTAGRYLAINLAAARAFGFGDTAHAIGRTVHDVFPPERAAIAEAEDREVLESGRPSYGILHRGALTGADRWWLANKIPLTDATGRVTGLIGISREVTGIEQDRAALADERDHLQQILDAVPDPVFVKDRTGRIILHNRATGDQFSGPGLSVIGSLPEDYLSGDSLAQVLRQDRTVLETGAPVINEIERSDISGRERWALVSKAPLYNERGEVDGLVGIARDVTALHEAERALEAERDQLQMILDSLPISVYLKDTDRRYVRINREAARNFGLSSPLEAIGKTAADLWDPESAERIERDDNLLLGSETEVIEDINRRVHPDGSVSVILYTKQVLRDASGRIIGTVSADRDITRVIALEGQLEEARSAEAEASREAASLLAARGGMLAMLSHDFRTPLTAIKGYADMLRDYDLDRDSIVDYASEISTAASRLAQLTGDMLELDRLQSGKEDLSLVPVDLEPVISEVSDLLAVPMHHEILLHLAPALPRVRGDAGALRRIFTNLIGNAIKYSPDGGAIEVSAEAGGDGFVAISIRDHGMGIPAGDLERIFEPYVRLELGKQRGIVGTGLGLPIVRELVRAQGGAVWAERAGDVGSIFRLRLPVANPA